MLAGALVSGVFAAGGIGLRAELALFVIVNAAITLSWIRGTVRALPLGSRLTRMAVLNRPSLLRAMACCALVATTWQSLPR